MTKFTVIEGGDQGSPTDNMLGLVAELNKMPREGVSFEAHSAFATLHDEMAGTDVDRPTDWQTVAQAALTITGAAINIIARDDLDGGSAA